MGRLVLQIPDELHERFKARAENMTQVVLDFIQGYCGEEPKSQSYQDAVEAMEAGLKAPREGTFETRASNPRAQKLKGDLKRYEESLKVISENLPKEVEAKEAIDLGGLKYEKEEF